MNCGLAVNPDQSHETAELIERLHAYGYSELVDVLSEEQNYIKRNGRLNASRVARQMSLQPKTLDRLLRAARRAIAGDDDEFWG